MDVDEPLVSARLEVLPRVLVLEGTLDDAVDVLLGGQRDRTGDGRTGTLGRLYDGLSAALDQLLIVGLQPYAYLLLSHSSLLAPVHAAGCVAMVSETLRTRVRTLSVLC